MTSTTHEPLSLSGDELAILSELLESEHVRLLVEIRHTEHRSFRDRLRRRLDAIERLAERVRHG